MMRWGFIAVGTTLGGEQGWGLEWPPGRLAQCHMLPRGGNVRHRTEYRRLGRGWGFWLFLGFPETGILFFGSPHI